MNTEVSLKNMVANKEMVLIYTNKKTEDFSVGTPVFILEDGWVVLKSVNPDGFFDGYLLKRVEDIYKIDSEDEYKYRLKKLFNFRSFYNEHETFNLIKCRTLKEFLLNVKDKVISALNYEGDFLIGEILKVENDWFEMQTCDFYGKNQSKVEISYDAIKSLNVGGIEETNLSIINLA